MSEKTIAAIATANGVGGIGIIRISGENAKEIADKIFKSSSNKKICAMKGYTASYGKIYDDNELIDDAVALVFNAPNSYTGEDVVEISCHGGLYVTRRVLRAILKNGASPAEAGEFTKRAFLNGKTGLTEAEAIMDIISANGSQSAKAALSCKEGRLRKRIDNICQRLLLSTAHLSAWADYPEDEIPEVTTDELMSTLAECKKELSLLLKQYDAGKIIREGVEAVIAGRPNVGKSTLMNMLSGCERSIVTNVPGTTRDIIEETIMLGDIPIRLSDTAGIRSTDDIVESIGVERAKDRVAASSLVFAVFDSSQPLSDDDKKLIELLKDTPALAVINKTDLEQKLDCELIKSKIKHIVYISALNEDGLQEIEAQVAEIVGTSDLDPSQGILANERQYTAAENALNAVTEAISALNAGITLDAITVIIEDGINSLFELTGERVTEKVVENVFSHFCVGK